MMIKGVNRHVVEISGMDSDYFEKAVLYIKSDKVTALPARLDLEARAELVKLMPEKREYPAKRVHFEARIAGGIICAALILLSFGVLIYLMAT